MMHDVNAARTSLELKLSVICVFYLNMCLGGKASFSTCGLFYASFITLFIILRINHVL